MNFADMWNTAAKQEKKQFGDLPPALYKAKVIACKFAPAKDTTKTNLVWDLQVTEGDQKNNHIFVYRSFSKTDASEQNQAAINRVLNDFVQLGVPATSDVIEKTMISLVGKIIEIDLKDDGKGGQYKNFKRFIDVAAVITPEVINPDEVPFGLTEEKPF